MLAVLGPPALGGLAGWSVAKRFDPDHPSSSANGPAFDKSKLQAVVDANGIALVVYPGPPVMVWQLVEVDKAGHVRRRSSWKGSDPIDLTFSAKGHLWRLTVEFCGNGPVPFVGVEGLGEIACVGINALFESMPHLDW